MWGSLLLQSDFNSTLCEIRYLEDDALLGVFEEAQLAEHARLGVRANRGLLKRLRGFHRTAKARIWSWQSYRD